MEKIEKLRDAVKISLLEWKEFLTPRIEPKDQKLEQKLSLMMKTIVICFYIPVGKEISASTVC